MLNVDSERVRKQLARILSSPAFADAERARRFLRFVVERKLEFKDLSVHFPELDSALEKPPTVIQLELDFEGFETTPRTPIVRLPVDANRRLRLTIRRTA